MLSAQCSHELELKHSLRLVRSVYDPTPPPTYPYLRALSCYSALVQLYSHSGQPPTATHLHSQHKIQSHPCHFGCLDIPEDNHHLFVECPYFTELRLNSLSDVVKFMEVKCWDIVENHLLSRERTQCLIVAAKSLFCNDSATWLLHRSAFYLGQIPDITKLLGFEQPTPPDPGRMIYNHLYLPFIAVTCTVVIRGQIDISKQL